METESNYIVHGGPGYLHAPFHQTISSFSYITHSTPTSVTSMHWYIRRIVEDFANVSTHDDEEPSTLSSGKDT